MPNARAENIKILPLECERELGQVMRRLLDIYAHSRNICGKMYMFGFLALCMLTGTFEIHKTTV